MIVIRHAFLRILAGLAINRLSVLKNFRDWRGVSSQYTTRLPEVMISSTHCTGRCWNMYDNLSIIIIQKKICERHVACYHHEVIRISLLVQISDVIKEHPVFSKELDWSARPGTKTYPRWKDALIGCFKAGRYPHLVSSSYFFQSKEGS